MKKKESNRLYKKAIALMNQRDFEEALAIASNLVETSPSFHNLLLIGELYSELGMLSDAISWFHKTIKQYPNDDLASLSLFHTLYQNNQKSEALNEMERYLSISSSPDYESMRGALYFELGIECSNDKERIALLETATHADPENAEAFLELGRSYKRLEELEKAEAAFRKSIALNDDGWAHLYLGNLYFSLGDWDKAEKEFMEGQARLPDVAAPVWCQADVYWKRGDLPKSEQLYRAAVNLQPDDTDALARIGRFLLETGKREEGEEYLQRALKKDPANKSALKWKEQYGIRIEADKA